MMINVFNAKKWDTWHDIVLASDVPPAMIMAMLQQIVLTKFCHQAYWQDTEIPILTQEDVIDQHPNITIIIGTITMTIKTGTGLAGLDPIPISPDIGVTVTVTLKEVALDPITDPHATAHHTTEAQAHIITNETPHTAESSSCRSFSKDNSRSRPSTSNKHHHKASTRLSSSFN